MDELLKRFTLIDFAGIFAPGAVLTLVLNFFGPDLSAPFDSFFGENAVMLAVYFLTISYLLGSALHQLGACLERLWKVNINHKKYCEAPEIRAAYQRCFQMELTGDFPEAGARIFHYLQQDSRPERIILFNSFYTMSRTMVVTLGILILITVFYKWTTLTFGAMVIRLAVYVLGIILFRSRWSRFEKKCIEEAYFLFSFQKLEPDGPSKGI